MPARQQSGIPFPVPWHLVPLNIYIRRQFVKTIMTSPHVIATAVARKSEGITSQWSTFNKYNKEQYYILPATPECDLPCPNLVSNMKSCGPIIIPYRTLINADPILENWLKCGPTVLLNFGSHWKMNSIIIVQIAKALRIAFDSFRETGNGPLQILWKLKSSEKQNNQDDEVMTTLTSILGPELGSKHVRIEQWLNAEPASIVASGHVVCSVHQRWCEFFL